MEETLEIQSQVAAKVPKITFSAEAAACQAKKLLSTLQQFLSQGSL